MGRGEAGTRWHAILSAIRMQARIRHFDRKNGRSGREVVRSARVTRATEERNSGDIQEHSTVTV
jgi:hypothetical protein